MKELKLSDADKKLIDGLRLTTTGLSRVKNPYSGATAILEPVQVALYLFIKETERNGGGELFTRALNIFMENWPEEYFTLLD